MSNGASKGFGCLFLVAFPTAVCAAVVIAVAHGGRNSTLVCAIAGVVAIGAIAGYLFSKAWVFARGRRAPGAIAGAAPGAVSTTGICGQCRTMPATMICVAHGLFLCGRCSQAHHRAGMCFYTVIQRAPAGVAERV